MSVESGAGECVLKTYLRDYDDDVTDPIITRDVTQCWLYCRSIRCQAITFSYLDVGDGNAG